MIELIVLSNLLAAAAMGTGYYRFRLRAAISVRSRLERHNAELRTQAAALRELLDAIPIPVWRHGSDFALIDCNRAYTAILRTAHERARSEARELTPGGSPRAAAARSATAGDCCKRFRVVINGEHRLFEAIERPAAGGRTLGFAVDCTETETMRDELSRHIGAHGKVLESIHAAIAIFGADTRLRFSNTAFAELWDLPEPWLSDRPAYAAVLEWLRERRRLPEVADFRAYKREQLRLFTDLIESQQELIHTPDGRTLELSVKPHPLGGLTFTYVNVTHYLALESSFNMLCQVQRATLDHLSEGVAVFGGDLRLKLHNPAYREIWNLRAGDLSGEPHLGEVLERIRPLIDDAGDWAAQKAALIAAMDARTPSSGPLYRIDGSALQQAAVPLPDGQTLLTYLDVSDSARVEQALREKAEALEAAGRLKSEFIASISYELRTPLNAIVGFAEILVNAYFGSLNPRQLDYARGILAGAHQLMTQIDSILDLASIEAGYMVLEPGPVDVAVLLRSVTDLARERAHSRGLDLALRCSPQIGRVEADARRLKQALFSLISNAIKFTPPGGAITVAGNRVDSDLLLSVEDTGIGIAHASRARVLDGLGAGARKAGSGLGLALVKSLIEIHGGTVAIEPAPECGTRVICRLPARVLPPVSGANRGGQQSSKKLSAHIIETMPRA